MEGERSDTGHVKNWLASPRCQKRSPHNQQGILPLCRAISSDSKCHYCKASAIRPSPFNPSNYSVGDAPDGLSKFAQHLSQICRSRAENVRVFFCWDIRGKSLSAIIKRWACSVMTVNITTSALKRVKILPDRVGLVWVEKWSSRDPALLWSGCGHFCITCHSARHNTMIQCWVVVYDAGPTSSQHWINVLCLQDRACRQ